jgi:hypothetical protein
MRQKMEVQTFARRFFYEQVLRFKPIRYHSGPPR